MNTLNDISDIVLILKEIMNKREDYLRCFCSKGVQVEGWFKAELLCLLAKLELTRQIQGFDREVAFSSGKTRVDFRIELSAATPSIWLEIKHWLIGYQKSYKYNSRFYFGDRSSVGIKPDVDRLNQIVHGNKFLLILATSNPGEEEWIKGTNTFNEKFGPLKLVPLTNPSEFPTFYFLGLLAIPNTDRVEMLT
ncbi:hypothetical protein ACFLYM_03055 [Chloroflexota bacterium]